MTKKNLYPLFLLIVVLCSFSNLQANNTKTPPTPEEMYLKKWEFISQKAGLTEEETEKVKPLFFDYENKVWTLHKKYGFKREEKSNLSYEEMNDNYIQKAVEKVELLKEYHDKLNQILSPEKLFNFYCAEREYKRFLINEMKGHPRHRIQE